MASYEDDVIDEAYWRWLRVYLEQIPEVFISALTSARAGLLLTEIGVGKKMKASRSAFPKLVKNESTGSIRLSSLAEAAEAMDCELIYFIKPKGHKDFAQVIWEKILPHAISHERYKTCEAKMRGKVLASLAIELMNDPEFRKKQNWAQRRSKSGPRRFKGAKSGEKKNNVHKP